jgi:hypothetical protein
MCTRHSIGAVEGPRFSGGGLRFGGRGNETPVSIVRRAVQMEALMSKRELIEPNEGDKRYVRRDGEGHFTKDQTDVGKSLAADQRQHSTTPAKKGQGDRGDRQN